MIDITDYAVVISSVIYAITAFILYLISIKGETKMMKMKITCAVCGKTFKPGNDRKTGMPNGVGLQADNGKILDLCNRCVTMYPYSSKIREKVDQLWADMGDESNDK